MPPSPPNHAIRAAAAAGRYRLSLRLYTSLLTTSRPDNFCFPFALNSCAALSLLAAGRAIHAHSLLLGYSADPFVDAALVDMYCKSGDVETARLVFNRMPHRDSVSWTSLISGLARNGHGPETLELFALMRQSGLSLTRVSLLGSLLACSHLGALRKGESFHTLTIVSGFEADVLVATAVVDMYAKCGCLDSATSVFDGTAGKDVVCHTAMIANYGFYGLGRDAIFAFDRMVDAGVRPNHTTFTSLLSSCSHSKLLEEGKRYFDSMRRVYGVEPKMNHYACMVDLLGRAGFLNEAEELVEQMPMEPDMSLLGSLLGACQIHGDLDLAERVADRIFGLGPSNSGYYVLLSNIYAAKLRWGDVERVRKLMIRRRVSKVQGFSLIEFGNDVHKFGAGDRCHPQVNEIYAHLKGLYATMEYIGYVPSTSFVLDDVEDDRKEGCVWP